jgi:transposase
MKNRIVITPEIIESMKEARLKGKTIPQIMKMFNVSEKSVSKHAPKYKRPQKKRETTAESQLFEHTQAFIY